MAGSSWACAGAAATTPASIAVARIISIRRMARPPIAFRRRYPARRGHALGTAISSETAHRNHGSECADRSGHDDLGRRPRAALYQCPVTVTGRPSSGSPRLRSSCGSVVADWRGEQHRNDDHGHHHEGGAPGVEHQGGRHPRRRALRLMLSYGEPGGTQSSPRCSVERRATMPRNALVLVYDRRRCLGQVLLPFSGKSSGSHLPLTQVNLTSPRRRAPAMPLRMHVPP